MTKTPAVDVYEEQDVVVMKAEIPRFSKKDAGVEVTDATSTIKGRRNGKKR